ncbi:MAG TPA: hypothetical protein DHV79_01865, partial [Lachnospiraceae bacterium]|nr:hypothetical protein [Lachnospiraceae bacterium]
GTDACAAGAHEDDACIAIGRTQEEGQPQGLERSRARTALARRDGSIYDGNAENRSDVYGFDASAMAYASCVRAAYPRAVVEVVEVRRDDARGHESDKDVVPAR